MKFRKTLLSATLALAALPALAETPIGELRSLQGITINGEVTGAWGNNFVLRDGSGQVLVDAGPDWYHDIGVREGERVTVIGKVDRDDFDAFSIRWSDGRQLDVRPSYGPPPWSGKQGKKGKHHEARSHASAAPLHNTQAVQAKLEQLGYTDIREIDIDHDEIEAKGRNAQGDIYELTLDARNLELIELKRD